MKILVCGSRTWTDKKAVWDELESLFADTTGEFVVIEGGARGADRMAGEWAKEMSAQHPSVKHRCFPAEWDKYGKSAGFRRNLQMLDEKPDLVLAAWDGVSRGTKHTIDEAQKRGIQIRIIYPFGEAGDATLGADE